MNVQSRLVDGKGSCLKRPYSYGSYSKVKGDKQAIRLTEGCVWNCPNCHEPSELKVFDFPKFERNNVLIFDMNLLCKPEAFDIIQQLGKIRVNGEPVVYELVCGADYRFITQEKPVLPLVTYWFSRQSARSFITWGFSCSFG